MVKTDDEMLDLAVDFLRDLRHEWNWKVGTIQKNDREMEQLDELIANIAARLCEKKASPCE